MSVSIQRRTVERLNGDAGNVAAAINSLHARIESTYRRPVAAHRPPAKHLRPIPAARARRSPIVASDWSWTTAISSISTGRMRLTPSAAAPGVLPRPRRLQRFTVLPQHDGRGQRAWLDGAGGALSRLFGRANRLPRSYHSGDSEHCDIVLREMRRRFPVRVIVAVGVSLGGNALTKWCGEQGDAAKAVIAAAASVSNPLGPRHLGGSHPAHPQLGVQHLFHAGDGRKLPSAWSSIRTCATRAFCETEELSAVR